MDGWVSMKPPPGKQTHLLFLTTRFRLTRSRNKYQVIELPVASSRHGKTFNFNRGQLKLDEGVPLKP